MKIIGYIEEIYTMSMKYDVPLQRVMDLVEFQDFKRVYRGGKDNLDLSCKVVDRYLRRNSGLENETP